ncbi:MAG: hypothetical protein Ct9H300mP1_09000 [Planctomycetaceae bacterium]|nr:MAG: hypothetical protein Ct9H300mP1_09000 [Planctomycetaceae bacterium]
MEIRARAADQSPPHPDHVVQPLLDGRPVSVAVLISDSGITCLPVAEQFVDTAETSPTTGAWCPASKPIPVVSGRHPPGRRGLRLYRGAEGWVGSICCWTVSRCRSSWKSTRA